MDETYSLLPGSLFQFFQHRLMHFPLLETQNPDVHRRRLFRSVLGVIATKWPFNSMPAEDGGMHGV